MSFRWSLRRLAGVLAGGVLLLGVTACSTQEAGRAVAAPGGPTGPDPGRSVQTGPKPPAGESPAGTRGSTFSAVGAPCSLIPTAGIEQFIDGPIEAEEDAAPTPFGWSASCTWITEFGGSSQHYGSIRLNIAGYDDVGESGRSGSDVAAAAFDDATAGGGIGGPWQPAEIPNADQAIMRAHDASGTGGLELKARVGNAILDVVYARNGAADAELQGRASLLVTTLIVNLDG